MFDWHKTTIDEVIESVKKARNHSRPWTINEDGSINENALVIDILPILEKLKEYESLEIDSEITDRIFTDYKEGYNTYNWQSPLSNDLEIHCGEIVTDNDYENYVLFAVHLYGDIRGNYTDYVALKMSFENFVSLDIWFDCVDVNDRYVADLDAWSEEYNVYDRETGEDVGYFCEVEKDELLKAIAEKKGE